MAQSCPVVGYILKEETVSSLTHSVMPGTYVLEIDHPFPGYYDIEAIDLTKPRSTLLLTREAINWETILRTTERLNVFLPFKLNAAYAEVHDGSRIHPAIRIQGMRNFDDIRTVQQALAQEGFVFIKARKKLKRYPVLIKIQKFFHIKALGEGIYADTRRKEMSYCLLPQKPNWEFFRKITMDVKYNATDQIFDVCLATFFMEDTIRDAIRIYKPNASLPFLEEIRSLYLKYLAYY